MTLGLAFPLLALHQTGSPVIASWIAAAGMGPRTLFHLPIGLMVDRQDPRTVMVLSHCVRIVCVLLLVIPVLFMDASITLLAAAAAVHGVCGTFHSTAATTALPYLVPREELTGAAAKNEARNHATQMAGRPLSGALFGLGHAMPALFDTVMSALSLWVALFLPRIRPSRRSPTPLSLRRDLSEGLAQLRKDRFLLLTVVACTVTNALFQMIWLIIMMLATEEGMSTALLGLILAATGAGGLLGSVLAPLTMRAFTPIGMITACLWAWVLVTGLLAVADHSSTAWLLAVLPVTWGGVGFVGAQMNVTVTSYHARNVPSWALGRVTGTLRFFSGGALPVGVLAGGYILEVAGVRATSLLITGTIIVLAVVFSAARLLPARRLRPPRSRFRTRGPSPDHPDPLPPAPGTAVLPASEGHSPAPAGPERPPPPDRYPSEPG